MKIKTIMRKIGIIILIIINMIVANGCWNFKEIEDLAIVAGVAIDKENDKYVLTSEIIEPIISSEKAQINPQIYSTEGTTIFEAARNTIVEEGRKLFWGHAKVVIISEKVAREGVVPILDFFVRDSEPRPTTWVVISKERTARDLLLFRKKIGIVSFDIEKIMESFVPSYQFTQIDLLRFRRDINSKGINATAATAEIYKKGDINNLKVQGTAVFKQDRMIGWINGEESKNKYIIMGKIKEGIIVIQNVDGINTKVTLEIFKNKTKNTVIVDNGKIKIKSKVEMTTAIDEIEGETDFTKKDKLEKLIAASEIYLKDQLESLVKKMQNEYGADIFGFGNSIHIQQPKLWKKIENQYEDVYKNIEYTVDVSINIKGSGRISHPIEKGL